MTGQVILLNLVLLGLAILAAWYPLGAFLAALAATAAVFVAFARRLDRA